MCQSFCHMLYVKTKQNYYTLGLKNEGAEIRFVTMQWQQVVGPKTLSRCRDSCRKCPALNIQHFVVLHQSPKNEKLYVFAERRSTLTTNFKSMFYLEPLFSCVLNFPHECSQLTNLIIDSGTCMTFFPIKPSYKNARLKYIIKK